RKLKQIIGRVSTSELLLDALPVELAGNIYAMVEDVPVARIKYNSGVLGEDLVLLPDREFKMETTAHPGINEIMHGIAIDDKNALIDLLRGVIAAVRTDPRRLDVSISTRFSGLIRPPEGWDAEEYADRRAFAKESWLPE